MENQVPPQLPRAKKRSGGSLLLREILFLILKIVLIVVVFMVIFTFIYGIHRQRDGTMEPAIKEGDLVVYYRFDQNYKAGDVLVLSYEGETQVRRVLAAAGDQVDITEEGLLINGALQQEPLIVNQVERYAKGVDFPMTVPKGKVFVLGDHRENVVDSRIYGAVNMNDTMGKVISLLRRRSI